MQIKNKTKFICSLCKMSKEKRSIILLEPHEVKQRDEKEYEQFVLKRREKRQREITKKKRTNKQQKVYLTDDVIRKSTEKQKPVRKKRTRFGGKASGRITNRGSNATAKIIDNPRDFDEFGRYKYFTTTFRNLVGIRSITTTLEKLETAYPDLKLSVLDNIPENFEPHLRLPPHAITQNVVAKFNLGRANIPFMDHVRKHPHVQYNPSAFAAVTIRVKNGCAALAFCSSSMVCTGTKSETNACNGAAMLLYLFSTWKIPCSLHDFIVENIVASAQLDFSLSLVDIKEWAVTLEECENVRYEPTLFPGLTFRFKCSKVVFLLFLKGKMVVTGARFASQITYMITWFYYNGLIRHRKDGVNSTSSEYRIKENMKYVHSTMRMMKGSKRAPPQPRDAEMDEMELQKEDEQLNNILNEHYQNTAEDIFDEEFESKDIYEAKSKMTYIPMEGYDEIIEKRRTQMIKEAEFNEEKYHNDFGLRRFAQDDISMIWWHNKQLKLMIEEDPRWYSTTLASPNEFNSFVFNAPRSTPIVDVKIYLSLKVMRLRHKLLTGHDKFEPCVLDMLTDCTRDEAFKRPFGVQMNVEPQPNLFVFNDDAAPYSAYWERTGDMEMLEKMEAIRDKLSLANTHEPPSSWASIAGDAPPFPQYKRRVRNVYDKTQLDNRQARFNLYQ